MGLLLRDHRLLVVIFAFSHLSIAAPVTSQKSIVEHETPCLPLYLTNPASTIKQAGIFAELKSIISLSVIESLNLADEIVPLRWSGYHFTGQIDLDISLDMDSLEDCDFRWILAMLDERVTSGSGTLMLLGQDLVSGFNLPRFYLEFQDSWACMAMTVLVKNTSTKGTTLGSVRAERNFAPADYGLQQPLSIPRYELALTAKVLTSGSHPDQPITLRLRAPFSVIFLSMVQKFGKEHDIEPYTGSISALPTVGQINLVIAADTSHATGSHIAQCEYNSIFPVLDTSIHGGT